jgi:hypothetical protein
VEQLHVTAIKFLMSGKILVEVSSSTTDNPPTPPAVNSVQTTLYMQYAPTDTIQEIRDKALQLARGIVKE